MAETDYITSDLQMSLLPAQIFYAWHLYFPLPGFLFGQRRQNPTSGDGSGKHRYLSADISIWCLLPDRVDARTYTTYRKDTSTQLRFHRHARDSQ